MIDVGQTVGNYRITAKLAEGGMGTVFLAEHPVIGSKVALKAIHPQFARNAEVYTRFVNEAKAVNQIGHDHIIDITDFGTTPTGDPYFTMEYLQGETLLEAIRRAGALPPARALHIAAQIADALGASHAHDIVHRDLKPENIFLVAREGTEDFVKVLDFGLAKLIHPDALAIRYSRLGTVMGTPYYMSPEQCEGRLDIDHRADIYALGVILFEMLTGTVPFGGDGYGEVLVKHITFEPPALRSFLPDLPAVLEIILSRCLAKNPAHRFQNMRGLRKALLNPALHEFLQQMPPQVSQGIPGRMRLAMPVAASLAERAAQPLTPQPGAVPAQPEAAVPAPSTFRDNTGEVWIREASRSAPAKTHRLRAGLLLGGLALLTVGAGVKYRHQTTGLLDSAAANVATRRGSDVVRLSFNSDPQGATVTRRDGTALGVTPLATDVPAGDVAIEYVVHKAGYVSRSASIVPKIPLASFWVLRRAESALLIPLPSAAVPPPRVSPPPAAPVHKRSLARARRFPRSFAKGVAMGGPVGLVVAPRVRPLPVADRDDILAPSNW